MYIPDVDPLLKVLTKMYEQAIDFNSPKEAFYFYATSPDFWMSIHMVFSIVLTFISGFMLGKILPVDKNALKYSWLTSALVLLVVFLIVLVSKIGLSGALARIIDLEKYYVFYVLNFLHILMTILMTYFHFNTDVHVGVDLAMWIVSALVIITVLYERTKNGSSSWVPQRPKIVTVLVDLSL